MIALNSWHAPFPWANGASVKTWLLLPCLHVQEWTWWLVTPTKEHLYNASVDRWYMVYIYYGGLGVHEFLIWKCKNLRNVKASGSLQHTRTYSDHELPAKLPAARLVRLPFQAMAPRSAKSTSCRIAGSRSLSCHTGSITQSPGLRGKGRRGSCCKAHHIWHSEGLGSGYGASGVSRFDWQISLVLMSQIRSLRFLPQPDLSGPPLFQVSKRPSVWRLFALTVTPPWAGSTKNPGCALTMKRKQRGCFQNAKCIRSRC